MQIVSNKKNINTTKTNSTELDENKIFSKTQKQSIYKFF
jgi:hypothetical protein